MCIHQLCLIPHKPSKQENISLEVCTSSIIQYSVYYPLHLIRSVGRKGLKVKIGKEGVIHSNDLAAGNTKAWRISVWGTIYYGYCCLSSVCFEKQNFCAEIT